MPSPNGNTNLLSTLNWALSGTDFHPGVGIIGENATGHMEYSALVAGAATLSSMVGMGAIGRVSTAAPVYTNGQTDLLSLDTSGNLRVTMAAGTLTVQGAETDADGYAAGQTDQLGCIAIGFQFDPVGANWRRDRWAALATFATGLLPATYVGASIEIALQGGFDGTNYIHLSADTFATAAPATIIGSFPAGVVSAADPVVVAGNTAGLSFTTADRLRVDAFVSSSGTLTVAGAETDADGYAAGQTDQIGAIAIGFQFDPVGANWRRERWAALATFATGLAPATYIGASMFIALRGGFDGTNYIHLSADTAGTVAPGTIIVDFPGAVVDTVDPTFTATHAQRFSLTPAGRLRVDSLVSTFTATVTVIGNQTDAATIASGTTNNVPVLGRNFFFNFDGTATTEWTRIPGRTDDAAFPFGTALPTGISVVYGRDSVGGANDVAIHAVSLTAALAPATVTFGLATIASTHAYDGTSVLAVGGATDGAVSGSQVGQFGLFFIQPSVPTTAGGFVAGDGLVPRAIIDVITRALGTAGSGAGAVLPHAGISQIFAWDPVTTTWMKVAFGLNGGVACDVSGTASWAATFSTAGSTWLRTINGLFGYNGTDLLTGWMFTVDSPARSSTPNGLVVATFTVGTEASERSYADLDGGMLIGTTKGDIFVRERGKLREEWFNNTAAIAGGGGSSTSAVLDLTDPYVAAQFLSKSRLVFISLITNGAAASTYIHEVQFSNDNVTFYVAMSYTSLDNTVMMFEINLTAGRYWRVVERNNNAGATTTRISSAVLVDHV